MINYEELSKEVSYALRHAPWEYELEMDEEGWVSVEQLVDALNKDMKWIGTSEDDLLVMIDKSEKKRHEISEHGLNRILDRINQGKISSIDEVIDVLNTGTKYIDTVNGGTVLFKNGISIHIAEDDFVKTVIGKAKVKSTWEVIE